MFVAAAVDDGGGGEFIHKHRHRMSSISEALTIFNFIPFFYLHLIVTLLSHYEPVECLHSKRFNGR